MEYRWEKYSDWTWREKMKNTKNEFKKYLGNRESSEILQTTGPSGGLKKK